MNKILRFLLQVTHTVIENVQISKDFIVVNVRPYKSRRFRCPVCAQRCKAYDASSSARHWRSLDFGSTRVYLEYRPTRILCPEHGVRVESVPWARHNSWFTRAFEEQVVWLCVNCNRSVVAEMMRIDWKTVGPICSRVFADLEASTPSGRYDNLEKIGIDETSYKKGHKYLTVVVDHDRNRVVWCSKGYGKDVLSSFFKQLSVEQRSSIEVVTADGARWIADVVAKYCPNATRVMDPFHVVSWINDALDELRKQSWRRANKLAKATPPRPRGRPRLDEVVNPEKKAASAIKAARYPLLKSNEKLTDYQRVKLEQIAREDKRLYRGYLLKEQLRSVFSVKEIGEATQLLDTWLASSCRCRIPEIVAISKKVRRHREAILRAVELGISNARIEATNNKIKLTIRMGYGFRNLDNLTAMIMLRCSDLPITLPGRKKAT